MGNDGTSASSTSRYDYTFWIGLDLETKNNIPNSKIHDCSYNISSVLMSILSLTEVMLSTSATIC